jgi:hypothetical protein
MRSNWWIVVVVGILVLGCLRVSVGKASSRKPTKRAAPQVVEKPPEEVVVTGYGATDIAARARALELAQEKVEELLAIRYGELGWRPSGDLLDPETLEQFKVIEEEGKLTPVVLDGDKGMSARYKVRLTPTYLKKVEKEARQDRVGDRHLVLARPLGGALAVLLVVVGYLRLEEATRGYYTKMLRLAAFVVLAIAGAGLWMTL